MTSRRARDESFPSKQRIIKSIGGDRRRRDMTDRLYGASDKASLINRSAIHRPGNKIYSRGRRGEMNAIISTIRAISVARYASVAKEIVPSLLNRCSPPRSDDDYLRSRRGTISPGTGGAMHRWLNGTVSAPAAAKFSIPAKGEIR
ncbi:hypothetical protein PUN28_018235 [Cardiocondyla obscurior]|uniref:Ribosomal protein S7 n=1 Tax=Cardiocondyla obscurior TaxID=286306 RepID=A0AAW2EGG9_9HYME